MVRCGVGSAPVLTIVFPGWQVWDGVYDPVSVGQAFTATVESSFVTVPVVVDSGKRPSMMHLGESRYAVTATVLAATDAVVLDLGPLRVIDWVRPGEARTGYTTGDTVTAEVVLGLNAWDGSSWTNSAIEEHAAEVRLHVDRITLWGPGHESGTELTEATMGTVDSAYEHCILDCRVLD